MPAVDSLGHAHIDSFHWDETECLNYYGMLSLHEVFDIVGSQLTEVDIEVLSFLLNEIYSAQHPLDPAGWMVEPTEDNPEDSGVAPSPELLKAWRRIKPKAIQPPLVDSKPKSGLELLLELERRGYLSDGNLEPLLQLLRVLTRHDLLPLVSRKRRRTVSPERIGHRYEVDNSELVFGLHHTCSPTEMQLPSFTQHLTTDFSSPVAGSSARRRRKRRGNGWSRRPKKTNRPFQPLPIPPAHHKVSCANITSSCFDLELWENDRGDDLSVALAQHNIRLRVRAEYLEHESALRDGVSSDKRQPLERQFELFSRASSLLRARDLGSIVCDIKFTELDNLEAFWGDYLSGALLEALKGVFITDSLRMAAGSEGVRLLISVDQDDYEEGRRLLRASKMMFSSHSGRRETH